MELHIFHTNDVHSELDRFAVLAHRLRAERRSAGQAGHSTLCFDLGDHIDCSHPVTNGTHGIVNAQLLATFQYDGWVFGNNETLTLDRRHWAAVVEAAAIPFYCSNLPVPETAAWQREDGDILERDGVRFGVFGVTVPYEKPFEALGLPVVDPGETARRTADSLRRRGADVVILLSHLGLQVDESLAEKEVPIDLIIGAHSHHFLEHGVRKGHTWISQAGKHARAFGHTVVRVDHGRVASVASKLVYTPPDGLADEAASAVLARNRTAAGQELETTITVLDSPLGHSLLEESQLANLLCDQVREELGADIAVINGGVIHAALRAGNVRRGDLLAICATPMRAVTLRMTGLAVWQLLNDGLDPALIEAEGFGYGFRGHHIGRLHVSGAVVDVLPERATGGGRERVCGIAVGGEPLIAERWYAVAVCEYIALSSRFPAVPDQDIVYHAPTLREMLARAIVDVDKIRLAARSRYNRRT